MELLYACHELKMFNGGEVTLGRVVEYVCHVPVSYTHLDVYKRQVYRFFGAYGDYA